MLNRLLAPLLLVLAVPAAAQPGLIGTWAMKAEGTTISELDVRHDAKGWSGTWLRPAKVSVEGDVFSNVAGPVEKRPSFAGRETDGGIELSFYDPAPNSTPDIFRLKTVDQNHAMLTYVGLGIEPIELVRLRTTVPLGPWDRTKVYRRVVHRPTNAEMTAIFDADQAARRDPAHIDWKKVGAEDDARRKRTQELLDTGALASGDDFYHAAFLFQHGGEPADYLKAHLLATVAVARGKPAATWIAAATLDRYLQSIKQPQVLGTQFLTPAGGHTSQEPYDRALVPDSVRQALGVPATADQEVQRQRYDDMHKAAGK